LSTNEPNDRSEQIRGKRLRRITNVVGYLAIANLQR
jgi:hypothetical protein